MPDNDPEIDPDRKTVYTGVRSDKFHESEDCAPDVMKRTKCTLAEAVDAQREPCGNCVTAPVCEAFHDYRGH